MIPRGAWLCLVVVAAAPSAAPQVAARDMPRGTVLAREDIAVLGDSAAVAYRLIGWHTRSVLRRGARLLPPQVGPPPIVVRGTTVSLRATVDGVAASREGIATSDGAVGDHVRVRLSTGQEVSGIVDGPSAVRADARTLTPRRPSPDPRSPAPPTTPSRRPQLP